MKNNLKESLLYRTGQAWKFWIQAFGGLVLVVTTVLTFDDSSMSKESYSILLWGGLAVGGICMIFSFVSIRCPNCGARWFWQAVSKKQKREGVGWFLNLKKCPVCNFDGKKIDIVSID